jgi:hypothetical protein
LHELYAHEILKPKPRNKLELMSFQKTKKILANLALKMIPKLLIAKKINVITPLLIYKY